MSFTFLSIVLAGVFVYMGVQIRGGNMDMLGKSIAEQIRPEQKMDYCREVSLPIFMLAAVEGVDVVLQTMKGLESWSLILMGAGMVICFGWVYMIHRKYKK